ncbi:MAG TPA: pilus assembly protein PilV [Casimicrobiaceae bacterium]|nr:pilus assembly protein PilV [Casimicrobiaceae bacterium]
MNRNHSPRAGQQGSFLLEALIGILVFSFGVLGLVGLQAQSIRHINDAQYRGEAVYLAQSVLSKMWADDQTTLAAKYQPGGAGYIQFREMVKSLPGGADTANAPTITVTAGPSVGSSLVTISVFWVMPGETAAQQHNYTMQAVVGLN